MNQQDILNQLNSLSLEKDKFIVINDASLVLQEMLDKTDTISLACNEEYYNSINWNERLDEFGNPIKYNQSFEISFYLYNNERIVMINEYCCMNLDYCLEIKKKLNQKKDHKIIEKLDLYLCSLDNTRYERELYQKNIHLIGGVDEVGRGPLVGPVVAACCVLPEDFHLEGLTDSKKLSEKKRNIFFDYIKEHAIAYGIAASSPEVIDEINIYEATKVAMKEAINQVRNQIPLEHVLIDAMPLELDIPSTSIIKGDIKSVNIAAASVLAKVTRDQMMYDLDKKYPQYGFASHKGYPTKKHIEAIQTYGLIDGYRKTYGPVKEILERVK